MLLIVNATGHEIVSLHLETTDNHPLARLTGGGVGEGDEKRWYVDGARSLASGETLHLGLILSVGSGCAVWALVH